MSVARQGTSLRSAVAQNLRERVINGELQRGVRLVEGEIAAELGVSRNPVREAFRALEQEGWLVSYPGAGVYVSDPTSDEVIDLFEVWGVLEGFAAALAAGRGISGTDAARFEELLAEGVQAARDRPTEALVELNNQFHQLVAKVSGNRELTRWLPAIDDRIRWLFAPVAGERAANSWREHRELFEAIKQSDEEAATRIMKTHVERTKEAYLHLVKTSLPAH